MLNKPKKSSDANPTALSSNNFSERAKLFGNKSANLMELQSIAEKISSSVGFPVSIPSICPLSHSDLLGFLDKHAPEWKKLWNEFADDVRKETKDTKDSKEKSEIDVINKTSLAKLEALQKLIITTFADSKNTIPETISRPILDYLTKLKKTDPNATLMVRSTGKEDSVELANPGGNESIAAVKPDLQSIQAALGKVVASYFGEKSLTQRMLGLGKETILEEPFIPVLIQHMIGEPLGGHPNPNSVIRSGVMYSGEADTRIQMAPGHGELIVNSKGAFDTFFVTRENIVHSIIEPKTIRLVPKENKLIEATNPSNLQFMPSISEETAFYLGKVAKAIEQHYKMPMDIEFVYDPGNPKIPNSEKLYLVQARPIPKRKQDILNSAQSNGLLSTISPAILKEVRKDAIKASVVSPGTKDAKVILSPDEIWVGTDIKDALDDFLKRSNSKKTAKPLKAVIIKNKAPTTSHEAAIFNSELIPVLQTPDIDKVEEWLKEAKPVLVLDPQQKLIVPMNANVKNHKAAEKELFDNKFLENLPPRESFKPIQRSGISSILLRDNFLPKLSKDISSIKKTDTLGDLIVRANSKDEKKSIEALNQLLTHLFLKLPSDKKQTLKDQKTPLFQLLNEKLQILKDAEPKKSNQNAFQALESILMIFSQFAHSKNGLKPHSPHNKLFKQAIIAGTEIYLSLKQLSQSNDSKTLESIRAEYLDLISAMDGLINSSANESLYLTSLKSIAEDNKALSRLENLSGVENLPAKKQAYLIEFMRLQKLALTQDIKNKWTQFTFEVVKSYDNIKKLTFILQFVVTNGIESDWLHNSFLKAFNTSEKETSQKNQATKILNTMLKESAQTKKELQKLELDTKKSLIHAWEKKLPQWANKEQFDTLFKQYQNEIVTMIDQLSLDEKTRPLAKNTLLKTVLDLTELMDKTIKSLKSSIQYHDAKELQTQRFYQLLEPYFKLMKKWVETIQDEYFTEWSKYITSNARHMNQKTEMLSRIESTFQMLKSKMYDKDINQMKPSGVFDVSGAVIGSTADFSRMFTSYKVTLEDLFTLMHQNIITSITLQNKDNLKNQSEKLPGVLLDFHRNILNISTSETKISNLIGITHQYPLVILEYNLPLRNHSAKIWIKYNQDSKTINLTFNIYGHNLGNRMGIIKQLVELESYLSQDKPLKKAEYDQDKYLFNSEFELNEKSCAPFMKNLTSFFSECVGMTFWVRPAVLNLIDKMNDPFIRSTLCKIPDFNSTQGFLTSEYVYASLNFLESIKPGASQKADINPPLFILNNFINIYDDFITPICQNFIERDFLNLSQTDKFVFFTNILNEKNKEIFFHLIEAHGLKIFSDYGYELFYKDPALLKDILTTIISNPNNLKYFKTETKYEVDLIILIDTFKNSSDDPRSESDLKIIYEMQQMLKEAERKAAITPPNNLSQLQVKINDIKLRSDEKKKESTGQHRAMHFGHKKQGSTAASPPAATPIITKK